MSQDVDLFISLQECKYVDILKKTPKESLLQKHHENRHHKPNTNKQKVTAVTVDISNIGILYVYPEDEGIPRNYNVSYSFKIVSYILLDAFRN